MFLIAAWNNGNVAFQESGCAIYMTGQQNYPPKKCSSKKKHNQTHRSAIAAVVNAKDNTGDEIEELEFLFDEEIAAPAKINNFTANL